MSTSMERDDLLPEERDLLAGKQPVAAAPAQADAATEDADANEASRAAAETAAADAAKAAAEAEAKAKTDSVKADAADTKTNDEPLDADALSEVANEGEAQTPAYQVESRDFAKERAALKEQTREVNKSWTDGTLTDAERDEKIEALQEQRDALVAAEAHAKAIEDINRQNALHEQLRVLNALAKSAASVIDYTAEKNAKAFDGMLKAVSADPENEGKPYAELVQLAHEGVCAVRGLKIAAPPPPVAAPAPPAAPAAPAAPSAPSMQAARAALPQTLGALPTAGANPTGNDFVQTLAAQNDPDAAEAALAAMPAAQRNALLRSTIQVGR